MILVNGHATEQISVHDRGLQYGDGVFETLAVRDGRPLLWERHMERLARGCERLAIPIPDRVQLRTEALSVCGETPRAVLKIIITRGSGARSYRVIQPLSATRILSLYPWPDAIDSCAAEGVAVRVCSTRLSDNIQLAGIKHLNRLEQVLARNEWDGAEIAEGLMLDRAGRVIEGTMSNLFIVQENELATPDLSAAGVAGIMRGLILELAAEMAIRVQVKLLTLEDVMAAREIFLCNSIIGLWPVRRLGEVAYPIGAVTRHLGEHLESYHR